jgi:hypothetical protein
MENTMHSMQNTMLGMFKTASDNWFAAMNQGLKTHDEMIATVEKPMIEKNQFDFLGESAGDAMFEATEFGRRSILEADKFAMDRTRRHMKIAETETDRLFDAEKMPRNFQEWNAMGQSMWKQGFEAWRENMEAASKIGRKQFEEAQTFGRTWFDRSRDEWSNCCNMNETAAKTGKARSATATKA